MFYTDDPVRDFYNHDAAAAKEQAKLPVCSICDEPIQDDFCYEINDELICEDCLNNHFRKRVDDYIE